MSLYDYVLKYVLIGDSYVGKSSIVYRYMRNGFNQDITPTICVEFGSKIVNYGDTKYKIHVWDTAGQESFNSITKSYYRNTCVAFIVFSFDNEESFKNVDKWISDLKEFTNNENLIIYLVGNKSELKTKYFYNDFNIRYFEVSAKNNIGIDELFNESIKDIDCLIKTEEHKQHIGVIKNTFQTNKKRNCC